MRTTLKIASFFVLLLSSTTLYAIDYSDLPAYEIEVVIFSFKNSHSAGSEIWPDLVTTESIENSIELHNSNSLTLIPGPDEKAYYYSKIPSDQYKLEKEINRLNKSKNYNIIYHQAWIQPGLDKENAEFIHIQSVDKSDDVPLIDTLSPINANQQSYDPGNPLFIAQDTTPKNNVLLDGVVKVELGRYLHVYFDLKYQRDLAPQQGVIDSTTSNSYKDIRYYPVQTHRRMRSKEVHYIDHPLIGILVLATPFELPETDETEELVDQPLFKLQNIPIKN